MTRSLFHSSTDEKRRSGLYVRRLLLICGSSSAIMASLAGALLLWAVIVDLYPVVQSW